MKEKRKTYCAPQLWVQPCGTTLLAGTGEGTERNVTVENENLTSGGIATPGNGAAYAKSVDIYLEDDDNLLEDMWAETLSKPFL